ncbi:hypothetical protein EDD25_2716 [Cryobacterium psychrophilum]|nr:hypothetical protein EDD25_2716 [Cryobacterium psychrophilum]
MIITCPFCHSRARLSPNPAHTSLNSRPVYLLVCSDCDRTSVKP